MSAQGHSEWLKRLAFEKGLSDRQTQLLALLSHRRSTVEIAQALGINTKTVSNNTRRLLTRLGVRTPAEMRAMCVKRIELSI